ncbi:hypothetical protein [Mucilaginibacter terrae]|uniref:HEAT repeat domain-containing protein n=1 Tax=Mucilaginibacter terrae TaxID=1955052 RepID=A0ABU3GS50_9SPHI|nr:hypothetical protein [Mucilaginibacter terrae]MDT3402603.1 hypothetical protein [Mucilaginibacter terrae]
MIDKETLTARLAARSAKNWVNALCAELEEQGFILTDLLELTLHKEDVIAFHAVWLLDTVVENDLGNYVAHIEQFTDYSQRITNHSCQRHYARIFMHFTKAARKSIPVRNKLAQTDLEPMVERCFDWLIDPKVKVAVKASASEVLFNLCGHYDWIAEELENQLRFLMQNGSPAINATGRRLLSGLQKR